jgi:hypothetical protein
VLLKVNNDSFILLGQQGMDTDWAKKYRNEVDELIRKYGKDAAKDLGAINSEGKYVYVKLTDKSTMADWKLGKEVGDVEYTCAFSVVDKDMNILTLRTSNVKAAKELKAAMLHEVQFDYAFDKKKENVIWLQDSWKIKDAVKDEDVSAMMLGPFKKFKTDNDNIIRLAENKSTETVLLEDVTVMALKIGENGMSSLITLESGSDKYTCIKVYLSGDLNGVSEGVPITILAGVGYADEKKSQVTLNGICYYIKPEFRPTLVAPHFSEKDM